MLARMVELESVNVYRDDIIKVVQEYCSSTRLALLTTWMSQPQRRFLLQQPDPSSSKALLL